jgi:hypothetical protein
MLFKEIIAACWEYHTKHIKSLWGRNAQLFIVKAGGTYSHHKGLKG